MYKIKDIKLTNFKFFLGDKVISLDRKHVLIYGENGSGKSSIYWGLHCFLHSTLKPDIESVRKYFTPITDSNKESIRNRYAMHDSKNSGVSLTLVHDDNSRYEDIRAEVSNKKVSTQTNSEIKLMTLSSELLNYKAIYNMYIATNKDSIKLFEYFKDNLMEFINFDQKLTTIHGDILSENSLEWWRYIEQGIDPYPGIGGLGYDDFVDHVILFNEKFSEFLQLITEEANRSLSEDFKEGFKIKFKYKAATYNEFNTHNRGRNKKTIAPEIELIIELPNIPEKYSIVERPQSYMNEARLSSIAIALRFAILKERYIMQAPKIMVLDDMLLSFDLGNRSSIVKILLKKYAPLYQLIILTHDRAYFSCVLNHLTETELCEDWKIFEMYEIENGGRKDSYTAKYESALSKALTYFKGLNNTPLDYNACGNNQRQALEAIFKKQFDTVILREGDTLPNGNVNPKAGQRFNTTDMMINECIVRAKELYANIGFDTSLLDELDIHRKQSLNPASHHNPESNFYKKEIQRTFEIIEILNKHKIEVLVHFDEELTFVVQCTSGTVHTYKTTILDNIIVYKKLDSDYYMIDTEERCYCMSECDGKLIEHKINNMTLQKLYEDTCNYYKSRGELVSYIDALDNFKYNGKTIRELINERNNG